MTVASFTEHDAAAHVQAEHRHKPVAVWLFSVCALVFLMVVVGGFTRLTGSGLSMVDWRPITGILPPLNPAQWQAVFEMYQASPQFQKVNYSMDVNAFKGIFWLEYIHRVLGRLIGLAFFVPFVWFVVRGNIRPAETPKFVGLFVLGGLQGLLGWYMVKSGLVDVPSVSQFRLTAHLGLAFLIYCAMFWVALSLIYPRQGQRHPWFNRTLAMLGVLVVTITSGGFVAGLRAGKIYNTFPMMGDHWLPPEALAMTPLWVNFVENAVAVQFSHRLLALITFSIIIVYFVRGSMAGFSRRADIGRHALMYTAVLQVSLGIAAILWSVPVVIGAAHQGVALLLLSSTVYLLHGLRDRA